MSEILVVAPKSRDTHRLIAALERDGRAPRHIQDPGDALVYLESAAAVALVIAEQDMPDISGLTLLRRMKKETGDVPPFVLMGEVTRSDAAGRALRLGALDFLPRPVSDLEAQAIVARALGEMQPNRGAGSGLEFEAEDGVLIIRFPPEMGQDEARELSQLLGEGFMPPERGVVVDLDRTTYMCSSGVGVLHLLAESCGGDRERLVVAGARPRLRHLFELAGVYHYYRTAESVHEAIASL